METRLIGIPGASLETSVWGEGEPIVFIQTALTADELKPVATRQELADYRKVLYYRRGYGTSSSSEGVASIARDAGDCAALLNELGIPRAHVVGLSYSGAVALQLAAFAPQVAHTVTLIEPPPVQTASAAEFRAANERLIRMRRERGPAAALDEFLRIVTGPDQEWVADEALPGWFSQMLRDSATFFDVDLPALLEWKFDRSHASRIGSPILYVGGTRSGPWFAQVRDLMLSWFPHADTVEIEGADHSLALTHAPQIAHELGAFLRQHPLTGSFSNAGS